MAAGRTAIPGVGSRAHTPCVTLIAAKSVLPMETCGLGWVATTRRPLPVADSARTAGPSGRAKVCLAGVGRAGRVQLGFLGLLVEVADLEGLVGGDEARGEEG